MLNLAIATLLVLPQAPVAVPAQPAVPAPAQAASAAPAPALGQDGLFPAPSGPLTLQVSGPESQLTVGDLVAEYCALTGQNAISSNDTKSLLGNMRLNLLNTLTVPADEVQHTFELLLRQNEFTLSILKGDGVRVIEIKSLLSTERNNMRAGALYLGPDQLDVARRHPAMLVSTVVTLPNTDVRQVSNSMRTMITDANTQQMLPAGNSNSMVLVGFGDAVCALADSLKTIDAATTIGAADRKTITEVVRLEHASAANVTALLQGALGLDPEKPDANTTKILSDDRTNSVLIVTPAKRLAGIKELIAALDAK